MSGVAPATAIRTSSASTASVGPRHSDFQRAGAGRISDQQVGRLQADRIERAAHRHAEVLIADAAAILDRRQQAGRDDAQATVSCGGVPDVVGRRHDSSAPSAALASRSSYSRSETGAKPTLSPGCSSGIDAPRLMSHSGTGRAPDQMPAARRLRREDAGHGHRDRDRAGRDFQPRRLPPRQRKLGRRRRPDRPGRAGSRAYRRDR